MLQRQADHVYYGLKIKKKEYERTKELAKQIPVEAAEKEANASHAKKMEEVANLKLKQEKIRLALLKRKYLAETLEEWKDTSDDEIEDN